MSTTQMLAQAARTFYSTWLVWHRHDPVKTPREALAGWLDQALKTLPQTEVEILVVSDERNNPISELDAGRVCCNVFLREYATPDICAVVNLPEQTFTDTDHQSKGANGERHYLSDITPPNEVNYAPLNWVYVIECPIGWVCAHGYISGAGAWMQARRFHCYADAQQAMENPKWHNDPDGVRRGRVVRLRVTIRALACRPGKTSAKERAR